MFIKKIIMRFFLLILFSVSVMANPLPWQMLNDGIPFETKFNPNCSGKYLKLKNESLQSVQNRKTYNVLNYNLKIDISDALKMADTIKIEDSVKYVSFKGVQSIRLVIDSSGTNKIVIDAGDMNINNIKINSLNRPGNFTFNNDDKETLVINWDTQFQKNDTLLVDIDYSVSRTNIKDLYKGLFLYSRTNLDSGLNVLEPIVYTQSETSDAHYWMPCNDTPVDKAISQISITVPEGFTAVSNGLLDSLTQKNNGKFNTSTFHWSHQSLIPPYLMAVTASRYSYYEQYYPRYTNNTDTVVIQNYMWEADLNVPDSSKFGARKMLINQPQILKVYSSLLGEYAFEKYGTVAVYPYEYGGMEHQTLTTINRNWLNRYSELGLAHEIAHHWLGDLITCASWSDIWINEGGATWLEALWIESIFQNDKYYYDEMLNKAKYFFEKQDSHLYPVYNVPEDSVFIRNYLTYDKAGWIYLMLSEITGREEFFTIMKNIFVNNRLQSVTSQEFTELIKQQTHSSKMDLDLFFDEWLYDSGYPVYDLSIIPTETQPGKFSYDFYINQTQTGQGFRNVYEMPLDIIFLDNDSNKIAAEPVYNNERIQKFSFTFDFPVRRATVDNRKVLCKIQNIATNVSDESPFPELKITPNPIQSGELFNIITAGNTEIYSVNIYDILGNHISSENCNSGSSFNILKSPENAGVYNIILSTNSGIIHKKIVVY